MERTEPWTLPPGWCRTTLGEVAIYHNGRAFKSTEWESCGLPIIRIQNLNNPSASYNYTSQEYQDRYRVGSGDLLFAWSASLGPHFWRGGSAWLNQHIFRVDPMPFVERSFLFYFLRDIVADIYSHAHGSGMVHITKKAFYTIPMLLPPLNEQRRIVAKLEELFSGLDKCVESLKAARAQLRTYRQSLLKAAFEGRLTEQWRDENADKLETADQLLHRIRKERKVRYERQLEAWNAAVEKGKRNGKREKKPKKPRVPSDPLGKGDYEVSELAPLPMGWRWDNLGWMTLGVEYGTSVKSQKNGDVPVIRMGNLQGGRIDWDDLVFSSDPDEIDEYILDSGDVLFNRTNSPELVGKSAIFCGERRAIFAGYLIRVNHFKCLVDSRYLNYFLGSKVALDHGALVKTDGVNQSNINGKKLSGYPFPYCSVLEQREISTRLDEKFSRMENLMHTVDVQIEKVDLLRRSILKRAFEGKLVPQDSSDEPASVLLERIRRERANEPTAGRRKRKVEASA